MQFHVFISTEFENFNLRAIMLKFNPSATMFQKMIGRLSIIMPYPSHSAIPADSSMGITKETSSIVLVRYPLTSCGTKPIVVSNPAAKPNTIQSSMPGNRPGRYHTFVSMLHRWNHWSLCNWEVITSVTHESSRSKSLKSQSVKIVTQSSFLDENIFITTMGRMSSS